MQEDPNFLFLRNMLFENNIAHLSPLKKYIVLHVVLQSADDDDAGDGVGNAHQRRMQRRSDAPDDEIADKAG